MRTQHYELTAKATLLLAKAAKVDDGVVVPGDVQELWRRGTE